MTTQKILVGDTWYPVNEVIAVAEGDNGTTDHGLLSGLEDDDHIQYLTNARGDSRYDSIGAAVSGDTNHVNATNPHPEYLTPAEGDLAYDPAGTAATGDSDHAGDANPHAQYLTNAEGNAAYDAIGTAAAGDSAHTAAGDPHSQYEALGDGMAWKGAWTSNVTYEANDVVRDDSWSMVANKTTTDKPAPQPTGDSFNVYEGLDPTDAVSSKSIIFGNRYSFGQGGYITGYRIYTVAGSDYTVYSIKDPDGDRIIEQLLTFNAKVTGWDSFSTPNTLVSAGTVVELVCSVTEPPDTPVSFVGNWNYSTPQNNAVPGSGEIIHATRESQSLRVDKDDITATDRDAELATLTVGDIIRNITGSWTIQGISSTSTYYDFTITPTTQIATGTQAFTFETIVATPIEFVKDPDYWLGSPYSVQGLYSPDGSSAGIVLDDNAYGTDITVQSALVSDDWDVLASPGSGGSSGGGVTDHGALLGLNDDDHPQYLRTDGTRALTGEMDAGNQDITDVNNLYTFNTTAVTMKVDNIEAGLDPPNIEVLAPLSIEVPVTAPLHATTKEYVDAAAAVERNLPADGLAIMATGATTWESEATARARYNLAAWTGRRRWVSIDYPTHPSPTGMVTGDLWKRHPEADPL